MTGSTHANHRSTRSPRPMPEGPARDNPIAGPQTGTTRSQPSAPASAGASRRHNEPGSRQASACPAQPPSKSGGERPRGGKRHHGFRKVDRSTESDWTGRGAAQNAGPRGTPERHAAGHNQATGTGAKQQRPPGAANPDCAHHIHTTTAREAVPSNTQPRGAPSKTHPRRPRIPRSKRRSTEAEALRGPRSSSEKGTRTRNARETRRPGLDHPRRTKLQEPPPRTGTSGEEQAGAAAAPRTGTSRDKWRWTPRTGSSGAEQAAGATPGLEHPVTRGGKRPGLDRPGKNMKERPQPRGLDQPGKRGVTPRAGTSGAEEAARAPIPQTGPDAAQRTTPRRSRDTGQRTRPSGCRAAMKGRGRGEAGR